MVGFVIQRRRGKIAGLASLLVLAGLIIPPAVVPTIWVLQHVHLFKTLPGLILSRSPSGCRSPCCSSGRSSRPSRASSTRPPSSTAAPASRLFFRVIFPLLRPVTITVILVQSVSIFNDFVNPLYFLPGDGNATVQLTLYNFLQPVQHPVQPAVHGHRADHHPAADHVHLLQPQDRLRHDRRRRERLTHNVTARTRGSTTDERMRRSRSELTALRPRASRSSCPSWAFGNSGTRFKVFAQQGVPRDPYEKIADAAQVHRFTGVAPRVSLHIPWDRVDDYAKLATSRRRPSACASARSTPTCSRTTTTCSARSPTPTRGSAARRPTTCSSASTSWTPTGSRDLKLWFSDGTNYPGQDDIRARQDRLADCAARGLRPARPDQRHAAGVQAVRAGFYTMDVPDWGTALRALPRARRRRPQVVRRHRPPRARHQHRVHRRVPAAGGQARRLRLQLPLLRRRRPDGRRRRPVPAVPDHARGRQGRRAHAREPCTALRWASASCSTSATTSSRRSPARSAR